MLGIIGTNGAGKSTLLKAVSGVMVPTSGKMEIHGSIAALLELASGFDQDLTVRENTYLRGAMLGYTRKFMDEKYEDIIAFAELDDFQERPFKHLSSGMKSRLAFSIACLVNPDILILDEPMNGLDRDGVNEIRQLLLKLKEQGKTILLASHNKEDIEVLCDEVFEMEHGKLQQIR